MCKPETSRRTAIERGIASLHCFARSFFNDQVERLAAYVSREAGVPVLGSGRHSSHWNQFICECRTLDFSGVTS
jgi:hypothetical protein